LIQTSNTAVVIIAVLPENAGLKQTLLRRENRVAASGTAGV
jgi:hypothetical protein